MIEFVKQVHVETIDREAVKARCDLPQDPLSRQSVICGRFHRVVRLRREPGKVPRLSDPIADPALAQAAAVGVRRIEPADSTVPTLAHQRECRFPVLAASDQVGKGSDPSEGRAAEQNSMRSLAGSPAGGDGVRHLTTITRDLTEL